MSRRAVMMAIVAARVVYAQAVLPPVGIPADDGADLLSRASEKVLRSTHRLPKYTCLETINRTFYVPPPEELRPHAMTEAPTDACIANRAGHGSLDAKDRLRVEVAEGGLGEIHSWPGASRFDTRSFGEMIPFGPVSTGSFGAYLLDVFENPGAQIKLIGSKAYGLRNVFVYSFRVPREVSHCHVKAPTGWRVTGFSGTFEIYTATGDLARLVIETDRLSPDTNMCYAKTTIDYHFMLIGGDEFLIPLRSELETLEPNGRQTDSVTEFSACREYTAESVIRFDKRDTSVSSIKTVPKRVTALPPGVSLTLALADGIDLATAAAGDPVFAKVVHSVHSQGSKEVLVPADAIAWGRILEMRHEFSSSQFLIAIRFDTLETKGGVSPISVRLAREVKAERRTPHGFVTRGTEFSLPAPASRELGSLLVFSAVRGANVIPAGYRSKWTTVAP
jgi:hypothetical protein